MVAKVLYQAGKKCLTCGLVWSDLFILNHLKTVPEAYVTEIIS